jgi:hypothetical protein
VELQQKLIELLGATAVRVETRNDSAGNQGNNDL